MSRRWSIGLVLSVLAHAAVAGLALVLGAHGRSGPIDIELTSLRIEEIKDFPLGAPQNGEGSKPKAPARARTRAPAVRNDTGALAARASDDKPRAGTAAAPAEEATPAPPSNLSTPGKEGARLTALMRLDRLRGTDYQAPVDRLLHVLPDRRELLTGTGLDLFNDFDSVLVATPDPANPRVTFLALRHHLDAASLRAALSRGLEGTDRKLDWSDRSGHFVGERVLVGPDAGPVKNRYAEDRLIMLFDPGLAVVTPRAYEQLLFEPSSPEGGVDAGAPLPGWASLPARIEAEERLALPEAVISVKMVGLLASRGGRADAPILYGMELPPAAEAVIGIDDGPFLDLLAGFKTEAPARAWEGAWPALQQKLRRNPYVILGGFSALLGRVTLQREGSEIHFHVAVTRDEALGLLALAQQALSGRFR
jgi:hypothetical protein